MNRYSLQEHLDTQLGSHKSTLKATSLDITNNEHLCQDETLCPVYDFDAYVKAMCPNPRPASPDAIYIGQKNLYCIEFKNQKPGDIDRDTIEQKFTSGTSILKKLLESFSAKDCEYRFCLVHKSMDQPRHMDSRHIQSRVDWGYLHDMNNRKLGSFYTEIVVEPLEFYVREFKALKC